jgi:xanthine/uracil permease
MENKENKSKKKVSNIMLAVIITLIVLYTAAAFILEAVYCREISPTLTGAYFSFCGVELVSLAAIKTSKVKHGQDTNVSEENIINEEE